MGKKPDNAPNANNDQLASLVKEFAALRAEVSFWSKAFFIVAGIVGAIVAYVFYGPIQETNKNTADLASLKDVPQTVKELVVSSAKLADLPQKVADSSKQIADAAVQSAKIEPQLTRMQTDFASAQSEAAKTFQSVQASLKEAVSAKMLSEVEERILAKLKRASEDATAAKAAAEAAKFASRQALVAPRRVVLISMAPDNWTPHEKEELEDGQVRATFSQTLKNLGKDAGDASTILIQSITTTEKPGSTSPLAMRIGGASVAATLDPGQLIWSIWTNDVERFRLAMESGDVRIQAQLGLLAP